MRRITATGEVLKDALRNALSGKCGGPISVSEVPHMRMISITCPHGHFYVTELAIANYRDERSLVMDLFRDHDRLVIEQARKRAQQAVYTRVFARFDDIPKITKEIEKITSTAPPEKKRRIRLGD
jgi:hypothetical protein